MELAAFWKRYEVGLVDFLREAGLYNDGQPLPLSATSPSREMWLTLETTLGQHHTDLTPSVRSSLTGERTRGHGCAAAPARQLAQAHAANP